MVEVWGRSPCRWRLLIEVWGRSPQPPDAESKVKPPVWSGGKEVRGKVPSAGRFLQFLHKNNTFYAYFGQIVNLKHRAIG